MNGSITISSTDVPLSTLSLLFSSSKNQTLACIDSINICSLLVSNFLFITNPKHEEAGRCFTQGECPCILLFLFRTVCSPVGPTGMRFLRSTNTATKSLSSGPGVGGLSIQQSYSLVYKTEEYSRQGKQQNGAQFCSRFLSDQEGDLFVARYLLLFQHGAKDCQGLSLGFRFLTIE